VTGRRSPALDGLGPKVIAIWHRRVGMDHLISSDGTPIAYERAGAGPPLVLVHGTGIDHRQWTSLASIPREVIGVRGYAFDADRFRDLRTPTLLTVGGESPPFYRAAVEALHRTLPHNRVAVLPGQQHEAMETAAELFLREVIGFFRTAEP
jgi:pimeloyl-ACP methyl ester carboxylesterase